MRLVRVHSKPQGEVTIAWYPFDHQGRPDFDNPLQQPYPLPTTGLAPALAVPTSLDLVVEDDYSQVYSVVVPEGGLPPWVFHYFYQALWEHILVVKHFLPPAPTSEDIERLDALTTQTHIA